MPTYNPSGQINLTVVGGTVPVGHYAADGSWNIVVNAGTGGPIGLYHPSGAYNAVVVTDPGSPYYSANGSMNVIANAASPSGFSPVQPAGSSSSAPGWVLPGASVDMDFVGNQYFGGTAASLLSSTRTSTATDILPSSPSGYVFKNIVGNAPILSPGTGLLVFDAKANLVLNSTVPATQTTGILSPNTYTLWVNGPGSAIVSAGTATIAGQAAATNGAPNTFTVSVSGTVVITVTGSLNFMQLETGAFGTPGVITVAATASRSQEVLIATGALATALNGASGTVVVCTTIVNTPISNNPRLLGLTAATTFQDYLNIQATGQMVQYNGSTLLSTTNSPAPLAPIKAGFAWTAGARTIACNGVAAVSSATAPNLSGNGNPQIGDGSPSMNGIITRITAWTTTLSPSVLTANTV